MQGVLYWQAISFKAKRVYEKVYRWDGEPQLKKPPASDGGLYC